MMRIRETFLAPMAMVMLSSCVPVPTYSVDTYAGSLNQCPDIQGTYEKGLYIVTYFLPKRFADANVARKFEILKPGDGGDVLKKMWITFRILDSQHLEAMLFSETGQSSKMIFDLSKKENFDSSENEEFVCNSSSWQKSYSQYGMTEGHDRKSRRYSKTTKLPDGTLKMEIKNDTWGGAFGLYMPDKGSINKTVYFRRVDLTVDDIRANNDKAKKAIAKYDEVATSPPPDR